jgi:histidyl-tRNA synthetase
MGIERILMLLESQGIEIDSSRKMDVFVASLGDEARVPAFTLVQSLRQAGIKADCDHMGKSLKAQFKYADKIDVPLIAILGGDELQKGVVKVRNMRTREETEIPVDIAAKAIDGLLA